MQLYRNTGAGYSTCSLKFNMFHRFIDYRFIIKELAKMFEG